MDVKALLKLLLPNISKDHIYGCDEDTLYRDCQPIASLNTLKRIKVSDDGTTLEFEDAEPLEIGR